MIEAVCHRERVARPEVNAYLMSGKFLETRRAKFGGCTAISTAEGSWIDKDIEYNEINSGFYVVAPRTEGSIRFFRDYKEVLKKRFDQLDILITYYPIENI
jgi:hypothetical protein